MFKDSFKGSAVIDETNPMSYHVMAIDLTNGERLLEEGESSLKQELGLGHILFLSSFLRKIKQKKVNLTEKATISKAVAAESKRDPMFRLNEGEKISILTLLHGFIIKGSTAAILALAEFFDPDRAEAVRMVRQKSKELDLNKEVAINITGRVLSKKPQAYDLNDLVTVGRDLFRLSFEEVKFLSFPCFEFQDKVIEHSSFLLANGKAYAAYMFGVNHSEGLVLTFINKKPIMLAVTGARDEFHRDFLITKLIDQIQSGEIGQVDLAAVKDMPILQQDEVTVNFLGDTYFGEDYTRKRLKRGIQDGLTKFGYDYSMQKLLPLFSAGDLNIVNFEATCIEKGSRSPYEGIKPYILWAEGEPSIQVLKDANVHAVSLGNNHAMDFGVEGLKTTLTDFKQAGITTFGAGMNADEAGQPLRLKIHDHTLYIMNAYWYRKAAYRSFESYASGESPGVASLSGDIIDRIKAIKLKDPKGFIIVQPHWGGDFQKTSALQRKHAEQLIDAGCDFILGHGPHTLQEIRKYKGKWIVFSVGNGVFNSNGEFSKYDAPPYGFVTQLNIKAKSELEINIKLFPFFANNLETFWQPHFVDDIQFAEVQRFLEQENSETKEMTVGFDQTEKYFAWCLSPSL